MLRGFVNAKCPHCGHRFKAPDIERSATIFSEPVNCPNCGKKVEIGYGSGQDGDLFSGIWKILKDLVFGKPPII